MEHGVGRQKPTACRAESASRPSFEAEQRLGECAGTLARVSGTLIVATWQCVEGQYRRPTGHRPIGGAPSSPRLCQCVPKLVWAALARFLRRNRFGQQSSTRCVLFEIAYRVPPQRCSLGSRSTARAELCGGGRPAGPFAWVKKNTDPWCSLVCVCSKVITPACYLFIFDISLYTQGAPYPAEDGGTRSHGETERIACKEGPASYPAAPVRRGRAPPWAG